MRGDDMWGAVYIYNPASVITQQQGIVQDFQCRSCSSVSKACALPLILTQKGPALPLEPTETQLERIHIAKLLAHIQF